MNKSILMGRLTKDPETRYTQNDKAVCSFTIAVKRRFKKDEADFINCVAWDKTAEFISQYFQKGGMIAVTGRIQTRNYEGNDGKKVYVTEVVVEEAYFTGSKQGETTKELTNSNNDFYPVDGPDELPF